MRVYSFLFFWMIRAAFAHPHQWINIVVDPVLDTQGQISALDEQWSFDPLYAQMLLQSALQAPDNAAQKAELKKITADVNQTLAEKNYYTFAGTAFRAAIKPHLTVEDGILYYRFRLPLTTPRKQLTYRIYEPSYFVEMRYDEEQQKTRWRNGCTLSIRESTPDPKMITAAWKIDITGRGPENLGAYFAQTSIMDCATQATDKD